MVIAEPALISPELPKLLFFKKYLESRGALSYYSFSRIPKTTRRHVLNLITPVQVELNRQDARGLSALHYAVLSMDSRRVEFLLEKGIDPKLKTKINYSVFPARSNAKAFAKILLKQLENKKSSDNQNEIVRLKKILRLLS